MIDLSKIKTGWFGFDKSDVSRRIATMVRLLEEEIRELELEVRRLTVFNLELEFRLNQLDPPAAEPAAAETVEPAPEGATGGQEAHIHELELEMRQLIARNLELESRLKQLGPDALPAAEPEAVASAEPEAVMAVEPEAVTLAEPEAARAVEPEAVASAEPAAAMVVEPEAVTLAEPAAAMAVEPEAVALAEPAAAMAVASAEPAAAMVVEPEAVVALAEPAAAMAVEPEAVASAEPAAVAPKTSKVVEFRRRSTDEQVQQAQEHAVSLPTAASMGFWGNANEVMDQVWMEDVASGAYHEVAASSAAAPYAPPEEPKRRDRREEAKELFFKPHSAAQTGAERKPAPTPAAEKSDANRPERDIAAAERLPANEAASAAISEEIRSLRSKYIVGKWAGEDLFDGAGRKIVAKGAEITDEVVEQADRSGKLAELIVHMIIPGLGD